MRIAAIILAAGSSTRLKTPKQLLEYKGKNLLQHTLDLATDLLVTDRILVLGGWSDRIIQQIETSSFEVLINSKHEEGMSSSLKLAIEHLQTKSPVDGILVLLCDQPLIPKSHYVQLLDQAIASPSSILASSYNKTMGVPCIFKADLFGELISLDGQQGAKFLLKKYKKEVVSIPCPEADFDIDTPLDYQNLLTRF